MDHDLREGEVVEGIVNILEFIVVQVEVLESV